MLTPLLTLARRQPSKVDQPESFQDVVVDVVVGAAKVLQVRPEQVPQVTPRRVRTIPALPQAKRVRVSQV